MRDGLLARNGPSDLGVSEGRHMPAHDSNLRACPLGNDRLGSGGRISSFRQLAQSPRTSGQEDQGETTAGSGGRSGGDRGATKDGRSSSCTITNRDQLVGPCHCSLVVQHVL